MTTLTNERAYIPRYFVKPRKDGRFGLCEIYIDPDAPNTLLIKHGATVNKDGVDVAWYGNTSHPQKSRNDKKINYKSPEMVALEEYERVIKSKIQEGYTEVADLRTLPDAEVVMSSAVEVNITNLLTLPIELPGFRPWKPQNTWKEGSKIWTKAQQGQAMFVRKMDGYGAMLIKDQHRFELFSLNMQHQSNVGGTLLERLPLVQWLIKGMDFLVPDRTMFLVELIPQQAEMDNTYEYVTSVIKSSVDEAVTKQRVVPLVLYVWDVLIWAGSPVGKMMPYIDRVGTIIDIAQSLECGGLTTGLTHLLHNTTDIDVRPIIKNGFPPVPDIFLEPDILRIPATCLNPVDYAQNVARENGYEGWVVTDPHEIFGEDAWTTTGRAPRPRCSAKLKAIFEDDFVALWEPENGVGEYGNGKNKHVIGAINLYQWEGDNMRFVGQCGSGFTDDDRKQLIPVLRKPTTVMVKYTGWTKHGMLRFPVFVRVRIDKDVTDCLYVNSLG